MTKKNIAITSFVLLFCASVVFANYYISNSDVTINKSSETVIEEVDDTLGTGSTFSTKWTNQNGLVTYVESGTFTDATTTFISVRNPFFNPTSTRAFSEFREGGYTPANFWTTTSTVDLAILNITGPATSTLQIYCGADNDGYDPDILPYTLISADIGASSTPLLENNVGVDASGHGIATNTSTKILMDASNPYFICTATSSDVAATWWQSTDGTTDESAIGIDAEAKGIMGADNTFDGTYKIRFYRNQY